VAGSYEEYARLPAAAMATDWYAAVCLAGELGEDVDMIARTITV
jgi:hypothetical protein